MKTTISCSPPQQVDPTAQVSLALYALDDLLAVLEDLAAGLLEQTRDFRKVIQKVDAVLTPPHPEISHGD